VSGGSVYKELSIRGMGSEYTLFLIDGKPMNGREAYDYNQNHVGLAANFLPPVSMIERIEVIKGPMSSLYGSEALGGVVNIITRKVPKEWSGSIKSEYTKSLNDISNDGYQTSINIAGPIINDVLSLQTYGSILKVDEAQCPQEYFLITGGSKAGGCGARLSAPSPDFDKRQTGAKLVLSINEANSAWAAYDYSKQVRTSTANISSIGGTHNANSLAVGQTASAGHDFKSENLIINTYIQNAVTKNPKISRSSAVGGGVGIEYEALTLNTQANYFFETNALSLGGQYKKESLDDHATNTNGAVAKRWSYALFAEDEWSIFENLALTGGFRFTNDEGFGTHVDPRIYLVYNLNDDWVVKGGVSSAYKSVTLRKFSDDFNSVTGSSGSMTLTRGNPDIKPERSVNYEASTAYTNKDIGFGASLTVYRSNFKDRITSETICDSPGACEYNGVFYDKISSHTNIGEAIIQGIEATLNYDLTPSASLSATYTYTDSEVKKEGGSGRGGVSAVGKPLNNISKHMFNMNADFKVNDKFDLWAQYNYNGKYPESDGVTTVTNQPYELVDIGAVIHLKKSMDVLVGLYNVFNEKVTSITHGRYIDGRKVTAGVNVDF
jgi:outer membrane receptor for ferrienterochelin and colicins